MQGRSVHRRRLVTNGQTDHRTGRDQPEQFNSSVNDFAEAEATVELKRSRTGKRRTSNVEVGHVDKNNKTYPLKVRCTPRCYR